MDVSIIFIFHVHNGQTACTDTSSTWLCARMVYMYPQWCLNVAAVLNQ